jgi:hypothetical protein
VNVYFSELERSTISNKPQPTKMVQTQKVAPAMQNKLQAAQGEIGKNASFVINFGGDPPIKVQWFQNGREIRSAFDTIIKTTEGESRLDLSKLKQNHEGEYTVRLTNVGGQCESSANLVVKPAVSKGSVPEFKQRISDQRAQQNQSIKFTAKVASTPRATISWFKVCLICVSSFRNDQITGWSANPQRLSLPNSGLRSRCFPGDQ